MSQLNSQPSSQASDPREVAIVGGHLTLTTSYSTRHIRLSRVMELSVAQNVGRWQIKAELADDSEVTLAVYDKEEEARAHETAAVWAQQIFGR